ncbi:MAG: segregation/condensation protein A [Candidatus Thermoplasmatota archaeon]|nr:segregation/condensation protein A [Candidatus Thermoplasmatota archaeon]
MKEEIINHILMQREDATKKESIEKYIEMAGDGNSSYIKDSFDRAIAVTFELVIDEQLDPWDIDLVSFSKMYLKRVKNSGIIDLMTAGRIILMAWKVLKLQSGHIVSMLQEKEEKESEWDEIPDWYMEDESYFYTRAVIEKGAPLQEKIRRKGERKVTLIELVNAFEEVRDEIEIKEKRRKHRKEEQKIFSERAEKEVEGNAHKEDIEEEISIILGKLSKLNGRAISIGEICNKNSKEELVMTISSLLFLAKERKIVIWQKDFPYGTIYIKNIHHEKK